jgi:cell division protein FtsQ
MDDRIRDRRRSVNQQRGRRRAIPIAILILVIVAAGLFLWLRSSSVFAVKIITATATEHVGKDEIAQAASPALGVSLLRVSTGAIEDALGALPYVRSADVYRDFPSTLEIRVREYEPMARVQASPGDLWLVSDDGRVLEKVTPPRGYSLPLVIPATSLTLGPGGQLPEEVVAALPVVGLLEEGDLTADLPDVKQVDVTAAGEVGLTLADNTQLRLGRPVELERKLKVAADIFKQNLKAGKQLEYVDVSVPERVAVKAR